jgi:acyl transferase domain-containing protein/NAD(P)-dependent dehydrogenase (short-subunit alcohol dehydrogenase family)/acyl carrier protein
MKKNKNIGNIMIRDQSEGIAIVGIGCRFPGGADSPQKFWDLLTSGKDGVVDIPADRWNQKKFYSKESKRNGKLYIQKGGFLREPIDTFDAEFFGISPREAECMDPQQRILLEIAWESLEDAGIVPSTLAGTNTGVYIGAFTLDNKLLQMNHLNRERIGQHTAIGSTMTMVSNRLSYFFDLKGPSISVDTACSSSLVATHYACQALLDGEVDIALAGGINIIFRPEYTIAMCQGGFLAKDGRSKSFDARADGYGRGEGGGIVILKKLSIALEDEDRIYAVIRGTGVNQDGKTNGITVPNGESQKKLIQQICYKAAIDTKEIDFVEAHGTGTLVGDPIEARALGEVIGKGRAKNNPCILTAIKSVTGHMEAAAGVGGLIKAALCLQKRIIPALTNLETPNPEIPFEELGLALPRGVVDLSKKNKKLLGAINSFGYGGTNAHAVLEEFQCTPLERSNIKEKHVKNNQEVENEFTSNILFYSAKNRESLLKSCKVYHDFFNNTPESAFDAVLYQAGVKREHHSSRIAIVGDSLNDMSSILQSVINEEDHSKGVFQGKIDLEEKPICVVLSGMGPQWWGMGQELYKCSKIYRDTVRECDALFNSIAGWSILEQMLQSEQSSRITETQIAQPANFILQVGLYRLLESLGVKASAFVGHSVGEVSAAYLSGSLSLHDAILVSYNRSRIQKKAAGIGGMLAVGMGMLQTMELLDAFNNRISIAAVNSSNALTLSGDSDGLLVIAKELEKEGIFNKFLDVEVAYHSPTMDPLEEEVYSSLENLKPQLPSIPVWSTVTGKQVSKHAFDAKYWFQNIRNPVYFHQAIQSLLREGYHTFLEVGPHPVLNRSVKETILEFKRNTLGFHKEATLHSLDEASVISSLKKNTSEEASVKELIAELYVHGAEIDFKKLFATKRLYAYTSIKLPNYQWNREAFWSESEESKQDRIGSYESGLLGEKMNMPYAAWCSELTSNYETYINDHVVDDLTVLPGASYVEIGLQLAEVIRKDEVKENEERRAPRSIILENITFENACIINNTCEQKLFTFYQAEAERYEIYSQEEGIWKKHSEGRIVTNYFPYTNVPQLSVIREQSLKEEWISIGRDEHYALMKERGLYYGDWFQGVMSIQIKQDGSELLSEIELENVQEMNRNMQQYIFHPALLDAAFQSLLETLHHEKDKNLYVPVGIRKISLLSTVPTKFTCYAKKYSYEQGRVVGDILLFKDDGALFCIIEGVAAAKIHQVTNNEKSLDALLYDYSWELKEFSNVVRDSGRWIIVSDVTNVDHDEYELRLHNMNLLALELSKRGKHEVFCITASANCYAENRTDSGFQHFNPDEQSQFETYLKEHIHKGLTGIVCIMSPQFEGEPAPTGTVYQSLSLFHTLLKSVINDKSIHKPDLYSVIFQSTNFADGDTLPLLQSAYAKGLGRVFINEYPELSLRIIDIPLKNFDLRILADELASIHDDEEVVLRSGYRRYVPRLQPLTKEVLQDRMIENNSFLKERSYRKPKAEEVVLHVHTTTLIHNDCKNSMSTREICTPEYMRLAWGYVYETGRLFQGIKQGEEVSCIVPDSDLTELPFLTINHSELIHSNTLQVRVKGEKEHGGIIAQVIAAYIFHDILECNPDESLLLIDDDNELGFYCRRYASEFCKNVYFTARESENISSEGCKGMRNFRDVFDVDRERAIYKSALIKKFDNIIVATDKFSSLDYYKILSHNGKIIFTDRKLKVDALLPCNATVHLLNVDALLAENLQIRELLRDILENEDDVSENKKFRLLTKRIDSKSFDKESSSSLEKYSYVLNVNDHEKTIFRYKERRAIDSDGTFLVTGGFGGFGLQVASWLARQGVKYIVLVGRNGAQSDEAKTVLKQLRQEGITICEAKVDVSNMNALQELLVEVKSTLAPLKAVFHAAAVLDDAPLVYLEKENFEKVFAPKAVGAWNLHKLTASLDLNYFVLFSSLTSLIGAPGQATYVAANCFLDTLSHYRRQLHLPSITINWGALGEVGMVTRYDEVEKYFERVGIHSISVQAALDAMDEVLRVKPEAITIADVDWNAWGSFNPAWARSPRFKGLLEAVKKNKGDSILPVVREVINKDEVEQVNIIRENFVQSVARILKLHPSKIDPLCSLTQMGLDSLLSMELQTVLQGTFGVKVSTLELMKGTPLQHIISLIKERISLLYTQNNEDRQQEKLVA